MITQKMRGSNECCFIKRQAASDHKISSLRRAIHTMKNSLDEQKVSLAEYRTNIKELKFIMKDMKQNMLEFDENLGNINITKLGDESRKLAQIMSRVSA